MTKRVNAEEMTFRAIVTRFMRSSGPIIRRHADPALLDVDGDRTPGLRVVLEFVRHADDLEALGCETDKAECRALRTLRVERRPGRLPAPALIGLIGDEGSGAEHGDVREGRSVYL